MWRPLAKHFRILRYIGMPLEVTRGMSGLRLCGWAYPNLALQVAVVCFPAVAAVAVIYVEGGQKVIGVEHLYIFLRKRFRKSKCKTEADRIQNFNGDLSEKLGMKVTDLVSAALLMVVSLISNFLLVLCSSRSGLADLNALASLVAGAHWARRGRLASEEECAGCAREARRRIMVDTNRE